MCTTCLSSWKLLLGVPNIAGVSDSDLDEVGVAAAARSLHENGIFHKEMFTI